MRVFISHSAADNEFTQSLAQDLQNFGMSVWYDEWEIRVGDSLVDKVFGGLQEADALVIVLSCASAKSRWVREELNLAVLRRITDNDIMILPVLKEDCPVPLPLRQLRYADFRSDRVTGLLSLLDRIAPSRALWESLGHLRDYHASVIQQVKEIGLDDPIEDYIDKLHNVMSSALDMRCQIELRRAKVKVDNMDFFQKISTLAQHGIDVRSETWQWLVDFRSVLAHQVNDHASTARAFLDFRRAGAGARDDRELLDDTLDKLAQLMDMICDAPTEDSKTQISS